MELLPIFMNEPPTTTAVLLQNTMFLAKVRRYLERNVGYKLLG